MTGGGSHLGFPIGKKNRGPSNDQEFRGSLVSTVQVVSKKHFETFFP
jgi:hypothetical protein